jgi:PqqD family protein of HPr-rel-A system
VHTAGEASDSGSEPRWRAADPASLIAVPVDGLTALYHRPSGQTHLLAEPAPEILAALSGRALTLAGLRDALAAAHNLEGDDAALQERVDELQAAGLIEPL